MAPMSTVAFTPITFKDLHKAVFFINLLTNDLCDGSESPTLTTARSCNNEKT